MGKLAASEEQEEQRLRDVPTAIQRSMTTSIPAPKLEGDDLSNAQIAKSSGVSTVSVSILHWQILNKLRAQVQADAA